MSFVSQETYLFNDTLRENIRLGRLDANEDEIQDAVNRANLTEFINSLPEGLNTQAGKGGKLLSGGQRQRIAIARALLKNAPLILMDEPASALDRESLIDIKETIRGLPEKYTVLVVSHSFMLFDENTQIYYMDNGEFTENGTMNELVAQKGKFSVQWKSQVENEEQIQN